ncbi:TonB-dependent siderophore receptor [Brevundimonas sp. SL130]|nr:TonB-dependent siderophore receptor [Brevundimonas sp. SL130]WAC61265.1 TonB-dependent siderophore receptor [Brevundimonas sp. SL130]
MVLDPSVLNASYGGGFDNLRLRGFAMDNFSTVRRDGLALAAHHDVQLENIERIDVLKGPSGFLYGFNSPGGTINYILKRPTEQSFLTATVGASTLEQRYVAMDGSATAFDGALGYRVNAGYEKVGNFDHARDLERAFFGVAADIRINDRALLQLNADWSEKTAIADPLLRADQSGRADPLDPATFVLPPEVDRRDLLTGGWYRHKTEGRNIDARFEIDLAGDWVSVTQANYSRAERNGGYTDLFDIQPNGDIGFGDLFASRGEVFSTYTIQSYISGELETGGIGHDLFFGASHRVFHDKAPFWDYIDTTGSLGVDDLTVRNILNPTQPSHFDFGPAQPIEYRSTVQEDSVFASDLISVTDKFQILLGGRYIWFRAEEQTATSPAQSENVFVPTGAVMYRPTANVLAYASYSKGFEDGDVAPFLANNANQPTSPIESRQYEIGLKADVFSGLSLGLAAFEIERDASYLNVANDFVADGTYRHRGIELTASGRVTSDLSISSGLALQDTELLGVVDTTTLGKRSEGVPEWQATLGTQYRISALPGLALDATVSHVGERPVDAQNSGFIPSFTLVDVGVTYDTHVAGTPVQFRVMAKNLFNEYYYAGTIYQAGLDIGRPREVLFVARASF